jgi:lysozyme
VTDQRLLSDVKGAEGCRLTAYKDTNGFWTVAYGHKLETGIDWEGYTVTQDTADQLLAMDLDAADEQAQALPEVAGLNGCRTNAVVELVYNMGYGTWLTFERCRKALHDSLWELASSELLSSKWAAEVGHTRSGRLAGYLLTGTYG